MDLLTVNHLHAKLMPPSKKFGKNLSILINIGTFDTCPRVRLPTPRAQDVEHFFHILFPKQSELQLSSHVLLHLLFYVLWPWTIGLVLTVDLP